MDACNEREREAKRAQEVSQAVARGGKVHNDAAAAISKAKAKAAAKAEKAKAEKAKAKAAAAAAKAAQAQHANNIAAVPPPPLAACNKRVFCIAFQTGQRKLGDKY